MILSLIIVVAVIIFQASREKRGDE